MADWTGAEFIALDEDLVAEGQPADALLEHLLANATRTLDALGDRVSWSPFRSSSDLGSVAGERAYASAVWTCWRIIPVVVDPDTSTLRVHLLAHVGHSDPDRDDPVSVRVRAELAGGFGRVDVTLDEGAAYTTHTIELPLARRPGTRFVTHLRLWVRSMPLGVRDTATSFAGQTTPAEMNAGATFYPAPTLPGPGSTLLSLQATERNGVWHDHLYRVDDESMIAARPALAGEADWRLRYLSWLQVRGLTLEFDHDADRPVPATLRAGVPHRAEVALGHVAAHHRHRSRPRHMVLGTRGELRGVAQTARAEALEWTYSTHKTPDRLVLECPLVSAEEAPTIEVHLAGIPVWWVDGYVAQGPEQLIEDGTAARWQVDAELVQYKFGGQFALGASSSGQVTMPMTHLPTDRSGRWPALTQAYWRDLSLGVGDYWSTPTLKEGQLFGDDLALLRLITLRFRAEDWTGSTLNAPATLRVTLTGLLDGLVWGAADEVQERDRLWWIGVSQAVVMYYG